MKLMKYKQFIENKISVVMPIPNDVKEIARAYHFSGKDLFIVGGAIRDFLQGKQPHDYDLVTNATPEESKKILKDFDVSDEQGKKFGVLRVYTEDEPLGYEIAVYRADVSLGRDVKGDDEKIKFGENIGMKKDSERRDLTINALYYDINKKEIVDLVGGVEDIENGIIRSVGDPRKRFNEDRLRILRVFRFTARTGGKIDERTSDAIKMDNRLRGIGPKDDVSQERIHEEWGKVMEHAAQDVEIMNSYIGLLTEYNMWEQMFPKMEVSNPRIDFNKRELHNAIIFDNLFHNVNITKNRRYMIRTLKFKAELVNETEFLSLFSDFTNGDGDVYNLAKKKDSYHIDDDLIRDFIPGKFTEAFIKFCNDGFVADGNILKEQGFKGKGIEDEKRRIETERFETEYLN